MRRALLFRAALGVVAVPVAGAWGDDLTFNIDLVSALDPIASTSNYYADIGADGNLAAIGTIGIDGRGVVILNITNPASPSLYSHYNPAGAAGGDFRDVIIRGNVGYFAIDDSSSSNGGIHVVDLSNPSSPSYITQIDQADAGFHHNHEIFIDGDYLYTASNQITTIKVFDISNPASPGFVRDIVTTGTSSQNLHNMTVLNGRMYTSNIDSGLTEIYDVSNPASPIFLKSFNTGTRNHSSWVTADGNTIAVAREGSNLDVQLWNIAGPGSPTILSTITRASTDPDIDAFTPHNPVIIGDTLYVSWYQAGLQVFNIRNPNSPIHLGAYDTFDGGVSGNPDPLFTSYDGNWGVHPFFGNDKILLSDIDNGLFIVDAIDAFKKVWTFVTNNSGKWQDNTKWSGDIGGGPFPNSSEMTASFTSLSAGTTRTLLVDGALSPAVPRVSGIELLSSLSYTIQPLNSGKIELNSSSGDARIQVLLGANSNGINRINAAIDLSDDLTVTNNSASASPSLFLGVINGAGRTLTFDGPGHTALNGSSTSFTGSAVVEAGWLHLHHVSALNAQPVTLAGGSLSLHGNVPVNFASSVHATQSGSLAVGNFTSGTGLLHTIGDVTVDAAKTLTLINNNDYRLASDHLTVNGTFLVQAHGGNVATMVSGDLTIGAGGKIDLTDNDLVFNGESYGDVEAKVKQGFNGGDWLGNGITSSAAAGDSSFVTALGVASNADLGYTSFSGHTGLSSAAVLVKFTYYGDADLGGTVNLDDFNQFLFGYNNGLGGPPAIWLNGDFDYNNSVNLDDFNQFLFGLQNQGVALVSPELFAALSGFITSQGIDVDVSSVPEPAGLSLLTLGSLLLSRRRGRA